MKKVHLAVVYIFFSCVTLHATVHIINVEDFEFNPSSLTVTVGDTMRWMWDNSAGVHTTTSTGIPSTAIGWDSPMDVSHQVFDYKITVPGTYNYKCTPHAGIGMVASFVAIGTSGINNFALGSYFILNNSISAGEIHITLNLNTPDLVQLQVYDMKGTLVKELSNAEREPGIYSENYAVNDLAKGLYLLKSQTRNNTVVRKIIIN